MHAPSTVPHRATTRHIGGLSRSWAVVALTALVGVVAGCTGTAPAPTDPVRASVERPHVSLLATWQGAELEAFHAVVAPFEAEMGIVVDYASTSDLRSELDRRIAAGDPPDIAGLVGPDHMTRMARSGSLRDLSGTLDVAGYRQQTAPAFVSLGMVDDRLVGVFLKATLKGLVWFDPGANDLGEPGSWDDLQRTALRFSNQRTRPWCVGLASGPASGWPGTDWIETILLRQSGHRAYDQWVAGTLPWTSSEVRRAFAAYLEVVADDVVAGGVEGAIGTDFQAAADGPFGEPPACLYTQGASFTPAFFREAGLQPGRDYDFFPLPALDARNAGSMEVAGDLFGMLTDRPEAAALMSWLVSRDAQRIWVQDGAALSGNVEVTGYPDVITRREAALLTGATDVRFDASDQMGEAVSQAFLAAVLRVTADPSSLDDALKGIDAIRAVSGRGAP